MKYLGDVMRLNELLAAELSGQRFDAVEADRLAQDLIQQCPDIAKSLSMLRRRLAAQLLADCA